MRESEITRCPPGRSTRANCGGLVETICEVTAGRYGQPLAEDLGETRP
jgi:hypothetical protein